MPSGRKGYALPYAVGAPACLHRCGGSTDHTRSEAQDSRVVVNRIEIVSGTKGVSVKLFRHSPSDQVEIWMRSKSSRWPAAMILVVGVLLVVCVLPAAAQGGATTADLGGIVRDDSHAVVPGANVSAVNIETNVERHILTDGEGRFLLAALPLGRYTVEASLSGFATERYQGVRLQLGGST